MDSVKRCFARIMLMLLSGLVCMGSVSAAELRLDRPVIWHEDDRRSVARPEERDPNLMWTMINDSVMLPLSRHTDPVRMFRRLAGLFGDTEAVSPAANVNSLDELPNSTWFTNRIGLRPLTTDEVSRGPGSGLGPERGAPWTVTSAKTQGVTPGFAVRDAAGFTFMIKFDPPGNLGMTSAAGVVSNRILHAAGYNVPDDAVVTFRAEDLVLGADVKIKGQDGRKRPMTQADLDDILDSVERLPDGRHLAISSRYISGRPIGPFAYRGLRKDDPNDHVPHQHRRELRGLYMFAAWINHFDTKQHNSLDAFDPGGFVKHYLIDFASTLGAGANGPTPRYGYECTLDLPIIFRRGLTLGFREDPWRRLTRPGNLSEVGYWESREFEPFAFAPLQPNTAFANCTNRDAYWAAKIISAFTDLHLAAICDNAGYQDPRASVYMARILCERRDKIARACFDRVPPLDFFRISGTRLEFADLGRERGIYPTAETRYRIRPVLVDVARRPLLEGEWLRSTETTFDLSLAPRVRTQAGVKSYLRLDLQVDRGAGWSRSVVVYCDTGAERVVALER
ncbi:MAG: hypothetical protein GY835_13780 [bacterium]|nr:hypothetical protein [bacterium]